ncbi:hypothetical protein PRUPE_4G233300 [Prunus persica]|uniref:Uncharacterized protein n=1 Tax=Prunus persica TaxID=3760 RepID=A0A251PQ22_PRUPE|nr:hypothetical protein PRUPE_4G233300 [Prunus persica]ONI13611.1 hypothetical protein PRUPE_4G233300 [Prunus persica]ONI13612.1 hypothetical protein PRUPE_4G233300 [Prunus persica]ONI13613.1 hypothetical protein PRUPE_4G233300 [Prunus persica]
MNNKPSSATPPSSKPTWVLPYKTQNLTDLYTLDKILSARVHDMINTSSMGYLHDPRSPQPHRPHRGFDLREPRERRAPEADR